MTYWKGFTWDLRPSVQGGYPVWNGKYPYDLPEVRVDTGPDECGRGWNFCRSIVDVISVTGLWPSARPVLLYAVEPLGRAIKRNRKYRTSRLRILRPATAEELADGVLEFSAIFGRQSGWMAHEQLLWAAALCRPRRDVQRVEAGLKEALRARGLAWRTRRYEAVWDVRDAAKWTAWASRDAWAAWSARDAWAAREAWAVWGTRASRDAWGTRSVWAARAAGDAWDARAARYALLLGFVARQGWVAHDPMMLTTGLREAYEHGLAMALPTTEPNTLGWAMAD